MLTINTILKELRNVPLDRLEDLYSIIHSLRANSKKQSHNKDQILSFAGAFGDMPESDFSEFQKHTKDTRGDLFSRDINV